MAGSSSKLVVYGATGALLVFMAIFMFCKAKALLVGRGAHALTLVSSRSFGTADPAVARLRSLLSLYLGPTNALLAPGTKAWRGLSLERVEQATERIQNAVQNRHPECRRVFVKAETLPSDPATPRA